MTADALKDQSQLRVAYQPGVLVAAFVVPAGDHERPRPQGVNPGIDGKFSGLVHFLPQRTHGGHAFGDAPARTGRSELGHQLSWKVIPRTIRITVEREQSNRCAIWVMFTPAA